MNNKSAIPAPDEIWSLIKETQENLKEVSASQKELSASQKELSASQKDTDRQMKKTDEKIHAIIGDFGNRWGKLGENLVKGSLVQRLNERGIKVERVITNAKNGSSEFDIIAINGERGCGCGSESHFRSL